MTVTNIKYTVTKIAGFVYLVCISFLVNNCTVGLNPSIKASNLAAPVSFTETFYTDDFRVVDSTDFRTIKTFSIEFTKWGVSSPLDLGSDQDISDVLNMLILENEGDAVTGLKIFVDNAEINKLLVFPKVISLWAGIAGISLLLAGESADNALLAGSAAVIYLFTPAKMNIKVEGKIVKLE